MLTGIFVQWYWKISDKRKNISNKLPYYQDPVAFIVSILLSVVITSVIYYILISFSLRNVIFD